MAGIKVAELTKSRMGIPRWVAMPCPQGGVMNIKEHPLYPEVIELIREGLKLSPIDFAALVIKWHEEKS